MSEATTNPRITISIPPNPRITIYTPPLLESRIRVAAAAAGQSLSVWLQRAAEAALREQEGG